MNNIIKLKEERIMSIVKYLFHISNFLLAVLYLYPGSIFGCFLYNDCYIQPQLTKDFLVSSNHVYSFGLLSIMGFINYYKKNKYLIIIYFFAISIIFECMHLVIPYRGFQFADLFGNIIGVLLSLIIINVIYFWKEKL